MHEPVHEPGAVEDGPRHDHPVNEVRTFYVDLLQNHAADAERDEMRPLDAEVIHDGEDVLGHDVEVVLGELRQDVLAEPVVTEVDEEQTVMRLKRLNLVLPRADAAPRAMHEDQPGRIGPCLVHHFVVKQCAAIGIQQHGTFLFHQAGNFGHRTRISIHRA